MRPRLMSVVDSASTIWSLAIVSTEFSAGGFESLDGFTSVAIVFAFHISESVCKGKFTLSDYCSKLQFQRFDNTNIVGGGGSRRPEPVK